MKKVIFITILAGIIFCAHDSFAQDTPQNMQTSQDFLKDVSQKLNKATTLDQAYKDEKANKEQQNKELSVLLQTLKDPFVPQLPQRKPVQTGASSQDNKGIQFNNKKCRICHNVRPCWYVR